MDHSSFSNGVQRSLAAGRRDMAIICSHGHQHIYCDSAKLCSASPVIAEFCHEFSVERKFDNQNVKKLCCNLSCSSPAAGHAHDTTEDAAMDTGDVQFDQTATLRQDFGAIDAFRQPCIPTHEQHNALKRPVSMLGSAAADESLIHFPAADDSASDWCQLLEFIYDGCRQIAIGWVSKKACSCSCHTAALFVDASTILLQYLGRQLCAAIIE